MGIYLGNTKIGSLYLGSTKISKAYLGTKQEQQTVWTRGTFRTTKGPSHNSTYVYLQINSADVNSTLLGKTLQLWYSNILSSSTKISSTNRVSYGSNTFTNGNTYHLYPAIVQFDMDVDNKLYSSGNQFTYIKRSTTALVSYKGGSTADIPVSRAESSAFSMNSVLGSFSSSKRTFFCFIGESNNAISLKNHIVATSTKYSAVTINHKYSTSTTVTVPRQIF